MEGVWVWNKIEDISPFLVALEFDKVGPGAQLIRIKVYDSGGSEFTVAKFDKIEEDESGNKLVSYVLLDKHGLEAMAQFVQRKSDSVIYEMYLYVLGGHMGLYYDMHRVD